MALPEELGIKTAVPAPAFRPPTPPSFDESSIPIPPSDRGKEATYSGTIEKRIAPDYSENLGLQIKENFRQTGFGLPIDDLQGPYAYSIAEAIQEYEDRKSGKSILTKDEANKLYPDMPTPFTGDIFPEIAQAQYDREKKRQRDLEWMARGPELGLISQIVAGIPAGILEPVNAALNYTGSKLLGLDAGLLKQFGSNVAENLLNDIGSNIVLKSQHQSTQSLQETVAGSIGGAIGGTAIHLAVSKAFDFASKKYGDLPKEIRAHELSENIIRKENNKEISIARSEEYRTRTKTGETADFRGTNYRYVPLEDAPTREFFSPTQSSNGKALVIDSDFGKGTYAIDDSNFARNITGESDGVASGTVRQIETPPADKLLDIDQSIDKAPEISEFIKSKTGQELPSEIKTVRDALDYLDQKITVGDIPESVRTDLHNSISKDKNVEGFRYLGERQDGLKDNRVFLFNDAPKILKEDIVNNKEIPPIKQSYSTNVPDEMSSLKDSQYGDTDVIEQVDVLGKKNIQDVLKDTDESALADQILFMDGKLQKYAETDKSLLAELEATNKEFSTASKQRKIGEDLIDCAGTD